ncbi:1-deoxy-D-xylulose-5-phosphate reductoisomerase [Hydrogenophaga crassostreae]|uniref:1-deoxy-D-xylulose 5-phosphate reductoisomerase n=1 Tax=Hydrogenophaga crassostreae TaxID=1763535 RepID=A0A167IEP5_9BURK|nr:1-deoxy-D-xylulose-5-phosphate reductoisomerase [Hydrogenophaga crassostreae]AOW13223.1 1-deoxy-D-xylulose-5-phosphate reductoisomerase [Hydrogenophaga crassostreae]OAD42629.1 1-deoxy-D-xylulose-5-phosphate reductoisomerase [Hydrogenophaga crassostreae]
MQTITILGSTGSIGTNTLDVIARHPDRFDVFALTAATQVELMLAQCRAFSPSYAVMASEPHARQLAERVKAEGLAVQVLSGEQALSEVSSAPDVHVVMAAIVGAAGLAPSLAAARAGKRLLLANKEALVVGGALFMSAVHEGGATLLPIDSEHSAIFQCLPPDASTWRHGIQHIMLTSSGGPFRDAPLNEMASITPDQACAHPNFVMGRKISVDSATMMNKALEVIEARWLFDLAPEQIQVLIHPQQIIHSMVQFHDASVLAQLGTPDMRVPIAYGLSWPERFESGADPLDFRQLAALTFREPDLQRYPGLGLAWETLRAPEGTSAVLNAANEVAVAAFLAGRLRFDQIHAVNHATLSSVQPSNPKSLHDLLALDAQARSFAESVVVRCAV